MKTNVLYYRHDGQHDSDDAQLNCNILNYILKVWKRYCKPGLCMSLRTSCSINYIQ